MSSLSLSLSLEVVASSRGLSVFLSSTMMCKRTIVSTAHSNLLFCRPRKAVAVALGLSLLKARVQLEWWRPRLWMTTPDMVLVVTPFRCLKMALGRLTS